MRKTFSCRGAARRRTARCATRWASRRSIRSGWGCCSSDFCRKSAANGPTSISICRAAISASARFSMFTNDTEDAGAAMTANVITYRGKSAAREIGKALSFDPETLARLASLVSAWEYKDSADTMENHFRDAGFDLNHPKIRKFFELCIQVQDLPRHLGQHSGGLVVCQGQLDSVVPLEQAIDAESRRRAVGQGRLRRPGHREDRSAGARDDGGAGRFAANHQQALRRRGRSRASAAGR